MFSRKDKPDQLEVHALDYRDMQEAGVSLKYISNIKYSLNGDNRNGAGINVLFDDVIVGLLIVAEDRNEGVYVIRYGHMGFKVLTSMHDALQHILNLQDTMYSCNCPVCAINRTNVFHTKYVVHPNQQDVFIPMGTHGSNDTDEHSGGINKWQ